jgi:hypothetical protein
LGRARPASSTAANSWSQYLLAEAAGVVAAVEVVVAMAGER